MAAYGAPIVQGNVTGVVLMHSTPNAVGGCPQALDRLLQVWQQAGYSFVTVRVAARAAHGAWIAPDANAMLLMVLLLLPTFPAACCRCPSLCVRAMGWHLTPSSRLRKRAACSKAQQQVRAPHAHARAALADVSWVPDCLSLAALQHCWLRCQQQHGPACMPYCCSLPGRSMLRF